MGSFDIASTGGNNHLAANVNTNELGIQPHTYFNLYLGHNYTESSRTWNSDDRTMLIDAAKKVWFYGDTVTTGNVGIGTDDPKQNLHVFKASSGQAAPYENSQLVIESDGTCGLSILTPDANSALIGFGSLSAALYCYMETNYNSGNPYFTYYIGGAHRFRLQSNGKVGIGTTDGPGTNSGGLRIHGSNSSGNFTSGVCEISNVGSGQDGCTLVVNSTIADTHADRGPFQVFKDGNHHINTTNNNLIYRYPSTTTTWDDSSDVRIKKNVVNLKGEGLSIVNQLRPVRFDYTDDFIEAENLESRHQHSYGGFIANEVREVLPDIVTSGSKEIGGEKWDDFLTMNETCFNSIMMASIQELSDKVDALEISNAELKAQISGSN